MKFVLTFAVSQYSNAIMLEPTVICVAVDEDLVLLPWRSGTAWREVRSPKQTTIDPAPFLIELRRLGKTRVTVNESARFRQLLWIEQSSLFVE